MLMRIYVGVALGCSALLLGCGGRAEKDKGAPPGKKSPAVAGGQKVTLEVEGMTRRLNLFWLEWPNKVLKALEGLSGVESVDVDLDNDRLHVHCDPAKVTTQELLQAVSTQGFTATIVARP